jgi:hypothetical protein
MSLLSNPRPLAFVMNAPVAANFSVANGLISISGLTDAFPKFSTLRLLTDGLEESQVAQTSNFSVAFTAAASTTYALNVTGVNTLTGLTEARQVSFTSGATFSAAGIAGALVNLVNALPFGATATGTGTPVTISGPASLVVVDAGNTTVASANTISPAPSAITQSIAPNGTAALAITGTTTVTISSAAAHGLLPGDTVDLTLAGGTTAQLFVDLRPGANQTGDLTISNVIVATVPTATTFTLQGVQALGGTYDGTNNNRTLTITTKNVVTVTSASHGLSVGNAVTISGLVGLNVNGGTSFTSLIRSVPSANSYVLLGAGNGVANSGTIAGALIPQPAKGYNYGTKVGTGVNSEWRAADGSGAVTAGQGYTLLGLEYANDVVDSISIRQAQSQQVYILLNEGATGYGASVKALQEILNNWAPNTTLANPASIAP